LLQNIGLRFDEPEDRLLLTVSSTSEQGLPIEHRLHLTRRVCGLWRPDLQAMVDLSAQLPDAMAPAAKAAVSNAHHQAMAAQTAVRVERVPATDPEQCRPLLVSRIECGRRRADGRWVLRFETLNNAPLSLFLSDRTLHGLVQALSMRLKATGWNLPALPTESPMAARVRPDAGLH
jgi:hypothetical protein